jgi:hypothetical protein
VSSGQPCIGLFWVYSDFIEFVAKKIRDISYAGTIMADSRLIILAPALYY